MAGQGGELQYPQVAPATTAGTQQKHEAFVAAAAAAAAAAAVAVALMEVGKLQPQDFPGLPAQLDASLNHLTTPPIHNESVSACGIAC